MGRQKRPEHSIHIHNPAALHEIKGVALQCSILVISTTETKVAPGAIMRCYSVRECVVSFLLGSLCVEAREGKVITPTDTDSQQQPQTKQGNY